MRVVEVFLRQASLVRPLSEQGKLQLASEMSQVEYVLNQWFVSCNVSYEQEPCQQWMRAYRQLLFLETTDICNQPSSLESILHILPQTLVVHQLILRSYPSTQIPLPLAFLAPVVGATEREYSAWLDSHTVDEAMHILGQCLDAYAQQTNKSGLAEYCVLYPVLRRITGT
jgi:conserved oligomeric Golgi complex subunit 5